MSHSTSQTTDAPRLRDEALDWFVRRGDVKLDPTEEESFQAWLAQSPAHPVAFARWQDEGRAVDAVPHEMRELLQRNLLADKAIDQARATHSAPVTTPLAPLVRTRPVPQNTPSRRRIWAPAFAVVAICAVTGGTGLLAWNHWQAQPVFEQAFSTHRGEQTEVPLPDGTRLRLGTSTRLNVAYYRHRREVRLLDGEAVFAVHSDAERPFQVLAGPVRVTVVGTRFSVRHTPQVVGNAGAHVAVEEGKVRVEPIMPNRGDSANGLDVVGAGVLLTAAQQVFSDALGELSAVSAVPAAGIASWRKNRVSFDNQRLDHALAELARYGDPQLLIRDPAVASLPITGVFDPRDMTTFRRILPASLPVQLAPAGGNVAEVVLAP